MSDRMFERAVLDWLEDGSDRTPPAAIDGVLLAVKTTPQDRELRLPRRFQLMTNSMRAAAGIAIVAVLAIGVVALSSMRSGVGGIPSAPPTTAPTASQSGVATIGTTLRFSVPFSSTIFGYDARFPEGWLSSPGTEPGSAADLAPGADGSASRFWDGFTPPGPGVTGSGIFGTSTQLPAGMSEDEWITAYQAPQVADNGRACIPERSTWEAITLDGRPGGIYTGCQFAEATFFVDGRVYDFYYLSPIADSSSAANRAVLEGFLANVSLHPERAMATSPSN